MGKQGPCYHCGVTSTPLWRNGPPEKPVLCNACGSRWRTKGTLVNYTPLHARLDTDYVDQRVSRVKNLLINKNKEAKPLIKTATYDAIASAVPEYNQGYEKFLDEDTSNRSSSGSAISNPESCAQFCSMDMNELTGPYQSNVWDSVVPSKKRTCVGRPKPSAVEKLTKDLFTIMQEQQISCSSGSSEEDLIFETATPMVSVEIGHGGVLIRHPSLIFHDEESEASSLTVENKHCPVNEAYCHLTNYSQESISMSSCKDAKPMDTSGHQMQQRQLNKNQMAHGELHILENPNSPLCNIDLSEILNFEVFLGQLSNDEQQQLLKYLPPVDIIDIPDSLEKMFASSQFKENICSFQNCLAEGVFDLSLCETKTEDCRTLKQLMLLNLSTSQWVEHYHRSKGWQNNNGKCHDKMETSIATPTNSVTLKRSLDILVQDVTEVKTTRSPKRMTVKAMYEAKERIDSDTSCYSPRKLFVLPTDHLVINPLNFTEQSSDQDVLLDIPSNGSFPQAELLTDY